MAAIAQVFTISYIANLLGEDEDWLFELSTDMLPEDGCLWAYGVGEDGVPAFTKDGCLWAYGVGEDGVPAFTKDGCLWAYGVGEDGVPAFTKDGIENLRQIIADERSAGRAPPQVKSAK